MCGITGWLAFDRDLTGEGPTLAGMTQTLAPRGPDGHGLWMDHRVALGHRRLAVIDVDGGAQPVSVRTPHGSVVMVYSGETYNYRELRAELRAHGHRFDTLCDTEVVLHAYLQWGDDFVDRLTGMYAMAIWDARVERLLLVRDRLGVKPLYVWPTEHGALFASEPKAIFAHPLPARRVDIDGLREMLAFKPHTPGHAMWAGLRDVLPGTTIAITREGLRERTYWRLRTDEHTDDRATTVDTIRGLLDEVVTQQLTADVPRCVLLSGGLDSSTITALSARHLTAQRERVRTFSVDFAGHADAFRGDVVRPARDTPFVHLVADHVGSVHREVVLDTAGLTDPAVRTEVITARELPVPLADLDMSSLALFRAIREHSTVALSGEAADEVFGGYPWLHTAPDGDDDTFPWLPAMGPSMRWPDPTDMLHPDLARKLDLAQYSRDQYATALAEIDSLSEDTATERRMRARYYLTLTRFLRDLLDRKDRLSMAVGLEVRVPYCDHRLVQYVYGTPWHMKVFDGREKSLLRAATRKVLPEPVLRRKKSPYPSTQDTGYARALQQQAREVLAQPNHSVWDIVDRDWLHGVVRHPPESLSPTARNGIDHALDIATWIDVFSPRLTV
ncbi:asparagine synthase (glutamine-hydrolyzing) [Streptomyces gardneri]|nr:asparagine synthase (glutamine-hydrolyzing) [Streptomyces gardneri]